MDKPFRPATSCETDLDYYGTDDGAVAEDIYCVSCHDELVDEQGQMCPACAGHQCVLCGNDGFRVTCRPDGDQEQVYACECPHGEAWLAKQPKASGRERGDDDGQEYGDPRDEMADGLSR